MSDASSNLKKVQGVVERLLDPEKGCPWDLKQTPQSLGRYILEETYELLAAIEEDGPEEISDEMGDCMFLLCMLARLFEKKRIFTLERVLSGAAAKMIARHPHIFGQGPELEDAEAVVAQWHQIKKKEKKGSLLGGVPKDLPALLRAHRMTERAGKVGFDWDGPAGVLESLEGEIDELKQAMAGDDRSHTAAELGDVLFTAANLARHLGVSAEEALRGANQRFFLRFQYIEEKLAAQNRTPDDATLAEMDRLWEEAKTRMG